MHGTFIITQASIVGFSSCVLSVLCSCVVVLLHPKKNKQSHIINTSRWDELLLLLLCA